MRGKTTTERNSKQITGRIVDNVKKNCQIINNHFYFQVQDDAWNDRTISEDHLIKKKQIEGWNPPPPQCLWGLK